MIGSFAASVKANFLVIGILSEPKLQKELPIAIDSLGNSVKI